MSNQKMTWEEFKRQWAIDGMPKDKQRLAEAAWQAALQESEAGAVAWMWRRDYAVGGFSTELCNTREQAESLLERFTEGGTVDSIHPLYTSQTTATKAAVAVAMMKCAEIARKYRSGNPMPYAPKAIANEILASIPAETTAALRELMVEVVADVWQRSVGVKCRLNNVVKEDLRRIVDAYIERS